MLRIYISVFLIYIAFIDGIVWLLQNSDDLIRRENLILWLEIIFCWLRRPNKI